MESFKRIMVALDQTLYDREVLLYTAHLVQLIRPQKIYFVHVDRDLEVADVFLKDISRHTPKDELLKIQVERDVDRYFANPFRISSKVEILEGKPLKTLTHWAKIKDIDLIVVGHKPLSDGSGVTAKKLLRESAASVLFVTPNEQLPVQRIVVPFDFSGPSDAALKIGLHFVKQLTQASLEAVHVFDVPIMNKYELQMDHSEITDKVFNHKRKVFQTYLEKQGLKNAGIGLELIENTHGRVAKYLADYVTQGQGTLVIMGASGHSGLDVFFLGSVTEKFLALNTNIPILVKRMKKNEES